MNSVWSYFAADRNGVVSSVVLHRRYSSRSPVDTVPSKPNPINYGCCDRIWCNLTPMRGAKARQNVALV